MNSKALEKAEARLRIAQKALDRMRGWKTYEDLEDDWFVFLRAWKAIYTTLEQGAKGNGNYILYLAGFDSLHARGTGRHFGIGRPPPTGRGEAGPVSRLGPRP